MALPAVASGTFGLRAMTGGIRHRVCAWPAATTVTTREASLRGRGWPLGGGPCVPGSTDGPGAVVRAPWCSSSCACSVACCRLSIVEAAHGSAGTRPAGVESGGRMPGASLLDGRAAGQGAPCVRLPAAAPRSHPGSRKRSSGQPDQSDRRAVRGRRACLRGGEERHDQGLHEPDRPDSDVFSDLTTNVQNYWDRGLLGLALDPEPHRTGTAVRVRAVRVRPHPRRAPRPRWGDTCPTPPARHRRLRGQRAAVAFAVSGNASRPGAGPRRGLVPAVPEPLDREPRVRARRRALRRAPATARASTVGTTASWAERRARPTPMNPCGDPPGGTMSPPERRRRPARAGLPDRDGGPPTTR